MGYITKSEGLQSPVVNRQKLFASILFGLVCLIAAAMIMIVDPLRLITRYYSRVAHGSYVHGALKREFAGVHVSAYLFNVTNADQFLAGEDKKLKVQEVGPFTYQEFRSNEDLEIDEEAGLMRYTPRTRVEFLPEESLARPEDVMVSLPNIAMLSIATKMSAFSYIPQLGFNLLTHHLKSKPVVEMTASEYLWGYDEPLIKLGNTIMPGLINFDTFGILDRLYDKKASYRFEVNARHSEKFKIESVNGCNGLKIWGYEDPSERSTCNSFTNTYEGIGYPFELAPDRPVRIYRNILCRILDLEFRGETTTEYGAKGLVYRISNKAYTRNNDTKCLCNRGTCLDGLSDLSPCLYGLPLVLSNAHFLYADPMLYEHIEGIKPNEEEHGSNFTIDPIVGLALTTKFSVQINVPVSDVSFNSKTSMFSNMVVPVAYFKIVQPPLMEEQIETLRLIYVTGPYVVRGIQVTLVLTGLLLLAYSGRLVYWNWVYPEKKAIAFHFTVTDKPSAELPLMSQQKWR